MHEQISASIAPTVLPKAVGRAMHRTRQQLGWTRTALIKRMTQEISPQALAYYEFGTRPCTVEIFADICQAMGFSPTDVLWMALRHHNQTLDREGG